MAFDKKKCIVKGVYCGKGNSFNNNNYSRLGDRYECMKKGYGAALHDKKNIPANSLQSIKYVGPTFEKNFKKVKITNKTNLVSKMTSLTASEKKKLLEKVFTTSRGCVDYKGYNYTLLYLYSQGVKRLPGCKEIVL